MALTSRQGGSEGSTGAARLVLALLAMCGGRSASSATCPPHDTVGHAHYMAHPRDCSMFLRCQEGREIPGHCPPGTAFLSHEGACGDPKLSACASCSPSGRCSYQCSCQVRRGQLSCPASTAFTALLQVSEPGCRRDEETFTLLGNKIGKVEILGSASNLSVKNCPGGHQPGRFIVPHFADCSKVFVCEGGLELERECPDGTLFNEKSGFCEEPQYVNCSAPADVGADPVEGCPPEAALLSCRYACDCVIAGGQGNCPPTLLLGFGISIFDSGRHPDCLREPGATALDKYVAVGRIEPNSTSGLYCPRAGTSKPMYIPHPTDCESFIVCFRGRQSVRRCPAGRQYDPASQRCGEADVSLCVSRHPSALVQQQEGLRCPTSWACSAVYRGVPHISDCTLYCRCDGARPVLAACPPGTHFSARSQTCEDPAVARCRPTCAQLGKLNGSGGEDRGMWQPKSCIDEDSKLGTKCRLKCYPNYELDGSIRVRCSRQGWASNGVLNIIPACRTPEEIGSRLVLKINESLAELGKRRTEMLFIIDEANTVRAQQFAIQKRLVASIIRIFPLSQQRLAGVATLSSDARVYIRLVQAATCNFLAELESMSWSPTRGRGAKRPPDITRGLGAVEADIDRRGSSSRALIFLITSKRSRTKPLPSADVLKKSRHLLFTIGVGKFNRKQLNLSSSRHKDGSRLFFGLSSVKATKKMAAHMSREYGSEETNYCF